MSISIGWRRQPLFFSALAAVAGILAAEFRPLAAASAADWLSLGLLALAAWLAPFCRNLPRAPFALALIFCLFGGLHQRRLADTYGHPLLHYLEQTTTPETGVEAEVRGRVLRVWVKPGERTRCDLLVSSVRLTKESRAWNEPCRLRVFLPKGHDPAIADECVLLGMLRPLQQAANEGEFAGRDFALRSGAVANLQITRVTPLESSRWRSIPRRLRDAADRCRTHIQQKLALGLEHRPDELTVIQAMALGASEDTDPRIEEPFRRSGTLHVFAVSGLHVGLISVILRWMLRPLRLRRPWLVAALVPLVFAYAFVTGWRPSAARAAIMVAILLAATLAQRRPALLNSLGVAALLLLGWDTHQFFQAGFQLSFGVLIAIALLAGLFAKQLKPWAELDPFLPPALATSAQQAGAGTRRFLAGLACVSGAAWLGSLPLMWFHFYTVTPIGLLANCLLVPLAGVCLGLVCASMSAGLLPLAGCWLQSLINQLNGCCAWLMIASAGGFAGVPGGNLHVPPPARWFGQPTAELRILALPFGGEAALLRLENRFWMLDCGSADDFGRTLLPVLRRSGANRIEGLFLSHGDTAHIGGAESLLRTMPVTALYHPAHEPWRLDSRATHMRRLLEGEGRFGKAGRFPLGQGDAVSLGNTGALRPARLTALYPGPKDTHNLADDRGLVALIELGALRILWAADAGFVTETALLERKENLHCDVLVRGAHGSDYHGAQAFLEAAAPRLIINTAPENLPNVKPPIAVRAHAARHGIPLLFLSEHGGVTIQLQDEQAAECTVETFKTGERHVLPLAGVARE